LAGGARYTIERRAWRWRRRLAGLPATADGRRLLHIGCGEVDAPGFINLDARPLPHVHFVRRDITRLTMIPDDALDRVYMCHVLEHVMRPRIVATLREMARILKPGGLLRLSVPDFDSIVRLYEAAGRDIRAIAAPLMGGQDYAQNIHYAVFNRDFLADQLLRAGFVGIADWHPHACAHHDFEDWASRPIRVGDRAFPVSLNLEAHKP
jgi:SAM-dependent methyltransferase